MDFLLDSDSDQSDFSGFGESDIEVPDLHDSSESSGSEDEDEHVAARADGWSSQFSNLRVCDIFKYMKQKKK